MNNSPNLTNAWAGPIDLSIPLDQMGIGNPHFLMKAAPKKQHSSFRPDNSPAEETSTKKKSILRKFNAIISQNAELRYDNELLVEKLDIVAAALGACIYCWGENEVCPTCQGGGKPGRFKPDREAFVEYVVPVVRKIRRLAHEIKISNQNSQQRHSA